MRDPKFWRDAIEGGRATFLVGAGISATPPSNLPLAAGLVQAILEPVSKASGLRPELSRSVVRVLSKLRPEVILDVLGEHLGIQILNPLLRVLRSRTNAWHKLLARSLGAGCSVITTNFDTLIEDACIPIGVSPTSVVGGSRRGLADSVTVHAASLLFKIHGSLSDRRDIESLAFAVRQVARGMSSQHRSLLKALVQDRPLVVLGYSGRDEFDILPALLAIPHSANTLWVIHDGARPLRELPPSSHRRLDARPALECKRAWPGQVTILSGNSAQLLPLLNPRLSLRRPRRSRNLGVEPKSPAEVPRQSTHWGGRSSSSTLGLAYGLIECRAFGLATRVIQHAMEQSLSPNARARHLVVSAVALQTRGTDLRQAQSVALEAARIAFEAGATRTYVLALDQCGVIARRRGKYRIALGLYEKALRAMVKKRGPKWLEIQIRSHRAIALEYLRERARAMHEYHVIAAYERRTGDLRGLVKTLNNMGIVHMNQRRFNAAIQCFSESSSLKKLLGDVRGTAQSMHNLGKTYFLAREYAKAESHFLSSLRLRRGRARDVHGVAQSYAGLARVLLDSGGARSKVHRFATLALEAHKAHGDARGVEDARNTLRALQSRI